MEVKITASFIIPGGKMYQEGDCQSDPEKYKSCSFKVSYPNPKSKKGDYKDIHETLRFDVRGCKDCVQTINMSQEAYEGMLNTPVDCSVNYWKRLTEAQRIIEHLKLIKHDLHAKSFTFTIFED